VGLESRDWYREAPRKPRQLLPWILGAAIAVAGLYAASPGGHRLLGIRDTRFGGEHSTRRDVKVAILPGAPAVTLYHAPLYAANDPWQSYLADERTCPGGERTDLALDQQVQVMVCLIDWARERRGLSGLPQAALLASTALQKAQEIVRCRNFNHAACGPDPDSDVRAAGYRGAFGENLYIAGGRFGAPRVALDGWLNSDGHRRNLFWPAWRIQGVAAVKLDQFGPYRNMTLWVSHFGSQ
jgi:uncharacterized protein YkwD